MNGSDKRTWRNCVAFSGAMAMATVTVVSIALLRSTPLAAAEPAAPPSTVVIPFSGIVHTDVEDISVSGTLHIQADVTLTPTTLFTRVHSNISATKGVGSTSGQAFVGVSVPLTMCFIPAGRRDSNAITLELTSQYQLIPTGPLSSFYARGGRQAPLLLLVQIRFQGDGTITGANAVVSSSRLASTPVIFQ